MDLYYLSIKAIDKIHRNEDYFVQLFFGVALVVIIAFIHYGWLTK
ncbi:hypothetical protein RI065_08325 [Mycoplasmatota bacterium zrk1]